MSSGEEFEKKAEREEKRENKNRTFQQEYRGFYQLEVKMKIIMVMSLMIEEEE